MAEQDGVKMKIIAAEVVGVTEVAAGKFFLSGTRRLIQKSQPLVSNACIEMLNKIQKVH